MAYPRATVIEGVSARMSVYPRPLFNDMNGGAWAFRRNPSISLPLDRVSRRSPEGIPYLCPEIVLLYKAKAPREVDTEDLERSCATLDADARQWLAAARIACHPEHEWIRRL